MRDTTIPKWMFIETLDQTDICTVCGKEYRRPLEPGYGYGSKVVCSYHCQRKLERESPNSYEYKKIHGEEKRSRPEPLTDLQVSVIRRMYAQGATCESIAKAIKRPVGSIASIIRRLGLKSRGSTGLSKEKIDKIISLWKGGMNGYQIAKEMNVVTSTVYKYVEGIQRDTKRRKEDEN